jgi:hypothetical protein
MTDMSVDSPVEVKLRREFKGCQRQQEGGWESSVTMPSSAYRYSALPASSMLVRREMNSEYSA